jgi:hypothetical protein
MLAVVEELKSDIVIFFSSAIHATEVPLCSTGNSAVRSTDIEMPLGKDASMLFQFLDYIEEMKIRLEKPP